MTYSPTVIASAVGEKIKSKPTPADVRKIQSLLKTVLGRDAPLFQDGICDAAMNKAIGDFQRKWGATPDNTVDPHGQTLKRLDRLANALHLKPIELGRVLASGAISDGGGYTIGARTCDGGPLPPRGSGYGVFLTVLNEQNAIDVSDRPLTDLMSQDNLKDLLNIIDRVNQWGVPLQCRVQLRYGGQTISTSAPQTLQAPVQPHNGKMLPLDEASNGAKLTYQGNPDTHDFHGRMFLELPGYTKCVFVYGGKLETQTTFRGFDCITYVGTACGASNQHMADSDDLAQSLNATSVNMVHKEPDKATGKAKAVAVTLDSCDPAYVKEFFADSPPGYYLMYSSGHIVIVANGMVHEFKASEPSGYNQTPVSEWLKPYKTKKLTVRQLPGKPLRAV